MSVGEAVARFPQVYTGYAAAVQPAFPELLETAHVFDRVRRTLDVLLARYPEGDLAFFAHGAPLAQGIIALTGRFDHVRRNHRRRKAVCKSGYTNVPSRIDLWRARFSCPHWLPRGIGILANDEPKLIGWKPMPLFCPRRSVQKQRGAGISCRSLAVAASRPVRHDAGGAGTGARAAVGFPRPFRCGAWDSSARGPTKLSPGNSCS